MAISMEEITPPTGGKVESKELEKKNRKLFNRFSLLLLVILIVALSYWSGFSRGEKNASIAEKHLPIENAIVINKDAPNNILDFSLFWKVWDILKEKYVDTSQLDSKKLFYGAIKGMLAATGDPYTNFFDPEENKKFHEEIKGSFEGIGAEVGMRGGVLTVIAPVKGSPAEKAGLRPGDKIIKIDDQSTLDLSIDQSVSLMRGSKGTKVKLTLIRGGVESAQEMIIERDTINVKSVTFEWKDKSIAHIKISQFGDTATHEFNLAINEILRGDSHPKGIIIDVRNNPGGYLDSAVNVASRMLPKGKTVVIEEDQDKKQDSLFAKGGDILSGIPTVVLINEGSASASEILAGALSDNRQNVTLVGEKSYGKGSVQEFVDLPNDSAVKITVAKWLTPNGEQINEKGIAPDREIKLTQEDFDNNRDPQLDEAVRILTGN